jgi:hypothetical protein
MVNPETSSYYDLTNYRPEESVGYLMRRILSSMAHGIDTQLANSDLTSAQWLPMLRLHQGHASTVAELARTCNLDAGAMTRLLDRLEAKGLCKRMRSESDRRVVNIALTEAGQNVAHGIPDVLCSVLNQHLSGLSLEEFSTLKSLLQRVLNNTTQSGVDATPLAFLSPAADCAAPPLSPEPPGSPDAL